MPTPLPTIIKHNFLTPEELEFITRRVMESGTKYDDIQEGELNAYYYTWRFYDPEFRDLRNLLETRIQTAANLELIFDHTHISHSVKPYHLHTDFDQRRMFPGKLNPAYTLIMPLETVNSNTVVFNQCSEYKDLEDYVEHDGGQPVPRDQRVSEEFRKQYLSHIELPYLEYLTLKEVFKWEQGSIHMCDRRHFHCSDNYKANGLTFKKALIFWTSVKI